MTVYTTADDAIIQAIIPALNGYEDDFDLAAIFDACFAYDRDEDGFVQVVDEDGFWEAVRAADNSDLQ